VRAALLNLFEHFELPLARVADDPGGTPLFVSFTDERPSGTSPGPAGTWQRIGTAPSYRRGYGLWFALTGNGLHALTASPDSRTRGPALDAFESTLATVLRQMVAG